METEFYNSLNWALTTDPAESLFPYDSLTPQPTQGDIWPDPRLELLLSASSYPVPIPDPQPELDPNTAVHLWGGLFATSSNSNNTDPLSDDGGSQPTDETTALAAQSSASKQRGSKSTDSGRKRGRPRKLVEDAGVNPDERRRVQVRMAQRAYRSRKEANVSTLKDRINQLETAVKQMSTAVISFGDELVRSGALESHPDLLKPLGNTVQACLALPALPHGDSDYQLDLPESTSSAPRKQKPALPGYPSPSSSEGDTIEIPEFIDRLHVTCSYQAYLVCANPAVPQRRLERPFRMLLSSMPRSLVSEYFKDWLLARAGHKPFGHWDHIPFYRIGGAGTHYPASGNVYYPFPSSNAATVDGDLSQFDPDTQHDLDDVWFDLGDLAGYLREKEVVFPASAPSINVNPMPLGETPAGTSPVASFIQALVRVAVCLGRSPGFRRRDIEDLVAAFIAKQQASST
ncbi:hypothetical protein BJX70DRAFT_355516 [Aspergillus crustosus]